MSDPGSGDGDAADTPDSAGDAAERRTSPDRRSDAEYGPAGGPPGDDSPGTAPRTTDDSGPETPVEWVKWFFYTDHGAVVYIREVVSSVALVLLVGLLLFAVSGLWPPMVAVESGSMNPHMERGDLVFVMEEHRLAAPAAYDDTGVVTYRTGQRTGYTKFQLAGDVIVYQPDGNDRTTPIIHRARFWVNESENWVANGKAQPEHLGGAESCGQLSQCPAPHAGFVTKGDANGRYDQVSGLSEPVKPAWVVGTAEFRIPWLGNIRLWAGQTTLEQGAVGAASPLEPEAGGAASAGTGVEANGTPGGANGTPRQCGWA
ncbi:S26 family signal peptidase [Haloglomus salinum]|jgi:signal peptidase|uniref:S26 family signal peptidase n=1 Tax=Haloglomus salinum TaxID=2962673 RepID=UPI0020C95114|nr:S26 family signal peptidase [Haloglomus salinum]